MLIRLKFPFRGAFHNHDSVRVGDVIEVDDIDGIGYIKAGYAEAVKDAALVETAVVSEDEEHAAPDEPVKRGPGRPRKT